MHSNYTCTVCVVFALLSAVFCAPARDAQEMVDPDVTEFYDQRQNGTENYRIDLKEFAIVISPLETLLSVATMLDPILFEEFKRSELRKDHADGSNSSQTTIAPTTDHEENELPLENKRKTGFKSRIGSFILPFVRRQH